MVAARTVVTLDYALHLGDGKIIEKSEPGDPLVYLHGVGEMVPGLEAALEGLGAGESKHVVVAPVDGYGDRDPEQVQTLPKSAFGDHELTEGEEIVASDEDGDEVSLRVVKVSAKDVTVDFNHPLAGATLHFDVTINDVREATADELVHGHVHGADDHHHD